MQNMLPCLRTQRGVTLVNLLSAGAISSILLATGIPALSNIVDNARGDAISHDILSAYQLAREMAITENELITFCGSNDGKVCHKKWRNYLIVFHDPNRDGVMSSQTELRYIQAVHLQNGYVTSRISARKKYTVMQPRGYPKYIGSMIYCNEKGEHESAKRVTWNRTGRIYHGKDKNKDGVIDGTGGKRITCR